MFRLVIVRLFSTVGGWVVTWVVLMVWWWLLLLTARGITLCRGLLPSDFICNRTEIILHIFDLVMNETTRLVGVWGLYYLHVVTICIVAIRWCSKWDINFRRYGEWLYQLEKLFLPFLFILFRWCLHNLFLTQLWARFSILLLLSD